ncbi:MAG: DUF2868 domain-containing protein [Desulfobacteraceae bacterium]|nr:DUF2868 domain-containing protein [Desulfobacteraceae bacterium]
MKTRWRIKDLIDLEYFLKSDENGGDESARKAQVQQDRDIYLRYIEPIMKTGETLSRRSIIRLWLKQRRVTEKEVLGDDTILPGEAFQEIHRLLLYVFVILGYLIGAGLAFSFLIYAGTRPLNVSIYLGAFIIVQILVLLLLVGFSLVRWVNRSVVRTSLLYSLVSGLLVKLLLKFKSAALKNLSGTQRDSIRLAIGLAQGKKRVYGSLFYWPVFILSQVFGVGFNLGVLSATLLRVLGTDIAFGWQSTVQLSTQVVFDLVKLIAVPWSWFIPSEMAYPSLAQIEGSRIVLKDGIYHLATQDLVSWWPFLCLAVLFYGLLPRITLLIGGFITQNRVLCKQEFNQSACDQLMHRMETPRVSTEGRPTGAEREKYTAVDDAQHLKDNAIIQEDAVTDNNVIALVPDDIYEGFSDDELNTVIYKTMGYHVQEKIRIGEEYQADRAVLDELSQKDWSDVLPNVLILQEAWQPPIQETLSFIQDLRKALGENSRIEVGLIGKPGPDTIFTPVKEEDWNIWNKKIKIMGDPYIRLERLVAHER